MATHSSTLAWRIPGTEEAGGLPSMGSHRVGQRLKVIQQQQQQWSHKQRSDVKLLSCVRLFVTPWTVAYQASQSMGFSRQEYQSGLPFLSPGDLPNPGIEPGSPALDADALTSEPPGKPINKEGSLNDNTSNFKKSYFWNDQLKTERRRGGENGRKRCEER